MRGGAKEGAERSGVIEAAKSGARLEDRNRCARPEGRLEKSVVRYCSDLRKALLAVGRDELGRAPGAPRLSCHGALAGDFQRAFRTDVAAGPALAATPSGTPLCQTDGWN
ncbi:hypothetical protein C0Z18_04265 [Trinickia dabaoshanensis]|uniref:Uncharacterized protein n=1 Tax=Trinickia dabaoshanensis TaxID=564714 RepID=A0A2N7VZG7_9BURK|nr:hypothetical protein C0Z18_04265 [Trinickia dabaoshanensis]